MRMYRYTISLTADDNQKCMFGVVTTSIADAIKLVTNACLAPESAITNIKIKELTQC